MNCIIVDDEPVARKGMKSLVEQIPQLTLVGRFNNAIAASAYINEYTVDLIFLDIQMPGITGIEFAQSNSREDVDCLYNGVCGYALVVMK